MSLVKDYMMRTLNSVCFNDTIEKAIKLMCNRELSVMPVVNESNEFMGTIYSQNILKNILPERYGLVGSKKHYLEITKAEERLDEIKDRKIEEYMTSNITAVKEKDKMDKIARIMLDNQESCIFVTNDNNNLRGYISRADLLLYLLDQSNNTGEE
ncbi:MAG: HPP family protein [Halanaerobiales bacterium]